MPTVEELVLVDEDGTERTITVTGLPRADYDLLLEEHPPRDADAGLWNEETFPPALIAACCDWSLDDAQGFWDRGGLDEAEETFETAARLSSPGSYAWAVRRLKRDGRLRLEMRFCNATGLDIEAFHRRTPRSQDLSLAQYVLDLDRCPGCNVASEAMQDPDAAQVDQLSCMHCEARSIMQKQIPDSDRDRVHLVVVPTVAEG